MNYFLKLHAEFVAEESLLTDAEYAARVDARYAIRKK